MSLIPKQSAAVAYTFPGNVTNGVKTNLASGDTLTVTGAYDVSGDDAVDCNPGGGNSCTITVSSTGSIGSDGSVILTRTGTTTLNINGGVVANSADPNFALDSFSATQVFNINVNSGGIITGGSLVEAVILNIDVDNAAFNVGLSTNNNMTNCTLNITNSGLVSRSLSYAAGTALSLNITDSTLSGNLSSSDLSATVNGATTISGNLTPNSGFANTMVIGANSLATYNSNGTVSNIRSITLSANNANVVNVARNWSGINSLFTIGTGNTLNVNMNSQAGGTISGSSSVTNNGTINIPNISPSTTATFDTGTITNNNLIVVNSNGILESDLTMNGGSTLRLVGTGTFNGSLSVGAASDLELQSSNTYSPNINLSGALDINIDSTSILNVNNGRTVSVSPAITCLGTINLNGTGNITSPISGTAGNGTLVIGNTSTNNYSVSAAITDINTINISDGSLTLSGGGSITGTSTINIADQTFNVNSTGSIAANINVGNSGNMNINAAGNVTGSITGVNGSTLTIGPSSTGSLSYANSITDVTNINILDGSLTLTGTGTATISSSTSAINVNDQALVINSTANIGAAINNTSGTITVGAAGTIDGDIDVGSGTLNINDTATIAGNLNINTGTTNLNAAVPISGNITGAAGSTLAIGTASTGSLSYSGTIANVANINITDGSLTLTGSGGISGTNTLNVNDQTLNLNNTGSLSSTINLTSGTINLNNTPSLSGSITGASGSTFAIGTSSTTNFISTNSFTDINNINIVAGSLTLNAGANIALSSSTSAINVNNQTFTINQGATVNATSLTSTGTVNFNENSSMSFTGDYIAGASSTNIIADNTTLTCNKITDNASAAWNLNGALTVNAASTSTLLGTYNLELSSAASNCSITHNGAALNANAASMNINSTINQGGVYTFTILSSDTGLTSPPDGKFTLYPTSSFFNNWNIATIGNELILTLRRTFLADQIDDSATEEKKLAILLDELLDKDSLTIEQAELLDRIESVPLAEIPNLITELAPQKNIDISHGEVQARAFTTINTHILAKNDIDSAGYMSGDELANAGYWLKTFGLKARQEKTKKSSPYKFSSFGFLVGYDTDVMDKYILGAAVGYSKGNLKYGVNSSSNLKSIQGFLYASRSFDNFFLSGVVNSSINHIKSERRVSYVNNEQTSMSNYYSKIIGLDISSGLDIEYSNGFELLPLTNITVNHIMNPEYNEYGGGSQDLSIAERNTTTARAAVGARLYLPFHNAFKYGYNEIRALIGYDVISSYQPVTAKFIFGSSEFSNQVSNERLSLSTSYSFNLQTNNYTIVQLAYDLEVRKRFSMHNLNIKFLLLS